MPELSTKHEVFARHVAAGLSAAAAARAAGFAPGYAGQTAARLMRRPDVQARVAEVRGELMQEYTPDWLIARFARLADAAEAEGQRAEAAGYLRDIGKILLPEEGRSAGLRRPALEADAPPTPVAELILKLDERERAEREGRLLELQPP